jgi:hypothetical protein
MSTPVKSVPRNYDIGTAQKFRSLEDRAEYDLLRARLRAADSATHHLQEDLQVAQQRLHRVQELEDKLEMILKHNTQLLEEISQLSALLHERDSAIDLLEAKLQRLMDSQSSLELSRTRHHSGLRLDMDRLQQDHKLEITRLH